MARYEPDIRAAAEKQLSLSELLDLLARNDSTDQERQAAIACYLSGSEGWAEAVQRLGGAFASDTARLRERKAD